jgi:hypothetical protein
MSLDLTILCKAGFGRTPDGYVRAKKLKPKWYLGRRSREPTDVVARRRDPRTAATPDSRARRDQAGQRWTILSERPRAGLDFSSMRRKYGPAIQGSCADIDLFFMRKTY